MHPLLKAPTIEGECTVCGQTVRMMESKPVANPVCLDCYESPQTAVSNHTVWGRVCQRMGVDPDVADISRIKDDDTREAFTEMVKSIMDGHGPCHALLLGPTGFGKTHAMLSLGAALVDHGMSPRQIVCGTEEELLVARPGDYGKRDMRETFDHDTRVILLDEFTRGRWTGQQGDGTNVYNEFLDRVKASGWSLIMTANYTRGRGSQAEGALEAAINPTVFSRVWALMDQEAMTPGEIRDGKAVDQRMVQRDT